MIIPTNIIEVILYLDDVISQEDKDLIIQSSEDDMSMHHHTVGQSLRNDWQLWDKESVLSKWFLSTLEIWHADDMSGIILTTYWRHLHSVAFDLEAQAKTYLDYWKAQGTEQ